VTFRRGRLAMRRRAQCPHSIIRCRVLVRWTIRCDFGGKEVRCDRCGREFVCTPADDLYCTDEGDHCCEGCLAAYPRRLIILDPTADVSRLGHTRGSESAPRGDAG
jgi:hypothetical protein